MANVIKSISIPLETWVAFDKQNPNINFSGWVTQQIKNAIKDKIAKEEKTIDLGKMAKMSGLTENDLREIIQEANNREVD